MPSNVPGSSQDRPRDLQDAKVEAPSMPNDTHGHHKPEIWSQKCQESGNQEPASQHTFQQSQGGRRQGRSRKIIKLRTSTSGSSTQPPSSNIDIRIPCVRELIIMCLGKSMCHLNNNVAFLIEKFGVFSVGGVGGLGDVIQWWRV